ncbi:MAG: hypothetical protein WDW38_001948 [Sanguina aurantia]
MTVADLVAEIASANVKAVRDRLKREKPNGKHLDSASPALFHTPLHASVKANSLAIVDILLGAGADVSAVDQAGGTPLHWVASQATGGDALKIAGALIAKGANTEALTAAKLTPLHIAAATAGAAPLISILATPANLELAGPGHTAVHAAANEGHWDGLQALAAAGAKLHTKDSGGLTALLILLTAGAHRHQVARQLLGLGDVGIDSQDEKSGHSALMIACSSTPPDLELVKALLAKGADVDLQDSVAKDTCLMMAARKENAALLRLLIQASKKLNGRNTSQESVLTLALANSGCADMAAVALAAGPDLGTDGPALMRDAMRAHRDALAAQLLPLLKPVQLTALDLSFVSLVAAALPKTAVAFLALSKEEHPLDEAIDALGNTQLHAAAAQASTTHELCTALLAMGASHAASNSEGDTPLHLAARSGCIPACKALLEGGADVMARNKKNRTPRGQVKLSEASRDYLLDAEEEAKVTRALKASSVWDEHMRATQTESAFGVRCV